MSAVGHCGDNAAAEGFFGVLKRERVNHRHYQTLPDARSDVFDIERFHNPRMQRRLNSRDHPEAGAGHRPGPPSRPEQQRAWRGQPIGAVAA